MKTYTEEDLRKAFQAGGDRALYDNYGVFGLSGYPLNEDEYIESLNPKVEEKTISFTYSFLRQKLDKIELDQLSGGHEVKEDDFFYITESKAKEFNLI